MSERANKLRSEMEAYERSGQRGRRSNLDEQAGERTSNLTSERANDSLLNPRSQLEFPHLRVSLSGFPRVHVRVLVHVHVRVLVHVRVVLSVFAEEFLPIFQSFTGIRRENKQIKGK